LYYYLYQYIVYYNTAVHQATEIYPHVRAGGIPLAAVATAGTGCILILREWEPRTDVTTSVHLGPHRNTDSVASEERVCHLGMPLQMPATIDTPALAPAESDVSEEAETESDVSKEGDVAIAVRESRTRWSRVSTTLLLTFRDDDLEQQYSKSLPKLNNISPSQTRREGCAIALGIFSLMSGFFVARLLMSPRVDHSSAIAWANYVAITVIPCAAVGLIRVVLYEHDPTKYLSRLHAASAIAFNLHSCAVVCFWGLISTTITTDGGPAQHFSDGMLHFDHVTFGSGSHAYALCLVAAAASSISGASGYFALFKPLFSSALVYTCTQMLSHIVLTGCLTGWYSTSDVYFGSVWLAMLFVTHAFMLISIYHSERCTRDIFLHGCALQAVLHEDAQLEQQEQEEREEQDDAEQRHRDIQLQAEFAMPGGGIAVEGEAEADKTALQACQALLQAAEQELRKAHAERKALAMLLSSSGQRADTAIDAAAICEEVQRKLAARVRVTQGQSLACSSEALLQVYGTKSLWSQAITHLVGSALDTDIDGAPAGRVTLEITEDLGHVRVEVMAWAAGEGLPSRSTDPSDLGSDMMVAQHLVRGMGSELYLEASPPSSLDGRGAWSRAFFLRPRLSPAVAQEECTHAQFGRRMPRARTRPRHEPRPRPAQVGPCMGGTGESGGTSDGDENRPTRRRPDRWRVAPMVQPGGDGASAGGGRPPGSGAGAGGRSVQGATSLLLNDIIFGGGSSIGYGGSIDCITRGRDGNR
jgi:hypothetical protein